MKTIDLNCVKCIIYDNQRVEEVHSYTFVKEYGRYSKLYELHLMKLWERERERERERLSID